MTIYIISLFLVFCFYTAIKPRAYSFSRNRRFIIISFMLIILVSALRKYTVGIDLNKYYYNSFIRYLSWDWADVVNNTYESGFYYFMLIIGKVFHEPQAFIALSSIITFGIIGWFILKNSEDVYLSVFIFITLCSWFMFMNIIRQTFAICFVLIACEVLKTKKGKSGIVCFVALVVLASLFHNSALAMLMLLPLFYMKFRKREVFISLIALVVVSFVYDKLFIWVASFMNHRDYVSVYLKQGLSDSGMLSTIMLVIYALIFGLATYVLVWKRNRQTADDSHVASCYQMGIQDRFSDDFLMYCMLAIVATRLLSANLTIIGRLSYYFYPFLWILIPRVLSNVKNPSNKRIIKFLVYVVGIVLFLMIGFTRADVLYGTVPYEFYWQ